MVKRIALAASLILAPAFIPASLSTDFANLKTEFENQDGWGVEMQLDIHNCNPELIRSKEAISRYVRELCDLIEMKRFGETQVVHFGEDEKVAGYSMIQFIETSLISGHFANATNASYINIFSCKLYDPQIVREFTAKFFGGTVANSTTTIRK